VLQRAVAEKRANRWDFDAVSVSSPELEALSRESSCKEINSGCTGNAGGDPPRPSRLGSAILNVFVQAYNTQAVKKRDLPGRWTDLLEPRLGLGYANIGGLLMTSGIPYDSEPAGRLPARSPRS